MCISALTFVIESTEKISSAIVLENRIGRTRDCSRGSLGFCSELFQNPINS
jgi:hypothetical protein